MKNYKSILLITVSIIALNNPHIIRTNNDNNLRHMVLNWLFPSAPESDYENHLTQQQKNWITRARNELNNFPTIDRQAILIELQERFSNKQPQTESACKNIRNEVVSDHFKAILTVTFNEFSFSEKEKDSIWRSMVGNVQAYLAQNSKLDDPRITQFFERESLYELIQQARQDLRTHNRQTYRPTYSHPQHPTYSPRPVQKPRPVKPSKSTTYRFSDSKLRNSLRNFPPIDRDAIIIELQERTNNKSPQTYANYKRIRNEVIADHARAVTTAMTSDRFYRASKEQKDAAIRSIVGDVQAHLAQSENLDHPRLTQFFERKSLEELLRQNINGTQSPKKTESPKHTPGQFAPSVPPAPFALSASEEKELDDGECFICEGDESGKLLSEITHFYKNDQEETLRSCTHPTKVHKKCLNNWLKSSSNRCPSCNLQVEGNVRGL